VESIVVGGSGFIGQHLISILDRNFINLDIVEKGNNYKFCDVRNLIDIKLSNQVKVIYNLAAVHKTPGHLDVEYFETNIKGAENVCDFARNNKINTIVFTSSIAPYSASEDEKKETTLPMPNTPYGISKLIAEEIHKRWQAENPGVRKLIIVRPGVVFGKNEGGNFTRLYRALQSDKFFYPGRKDTKKASIYVKNLVYLMLEFTENEKPGIHLYNMAYKPIHTIEEICQAMAKITDVKVPKITIPSGILKFVASIIQVLGKVIGYSFDGIHPDRVEKLMISTNINGQKLLDNGYKMKYSFEEAVEDWYKDCGKKELK